MMQNAGEEDEIELYNNDDYRIGELIYSAIRKLTYPKRKKEHEDREAKMRWKKEYKRKKAPDNKTDFGI